MPDKHVKSYLRELQRGHSGARPGNVERGAIDTALDYIDFLEATIMKIEDQYPGLTIQVRSGVPKKPTAILDGSFELLRRTTDEVFGRSTIEAWGGTGIATHWEVWAEH